MPADPGAAAPHPANQALVDAYARHLATRPSHTRAAYVRDVAKLAQLAGDKRLPALGAADLRRCLATLHARGLAGRSLARTLSAWRGFYRFLLDAEHGLIENPCTGLRAPRSPKRLPSALSPDEAVQLVAIDASDPAGLRDRALFELAYSSGLRLAELAGLDLGRVDLVTGEVRVWGKGAKERIVPVGRAARDAIGAWLVVRDAVASPGEAALFVGERGRRVTARTIQRRLAQWAVRQGLGRHVHPHMLRHSFASHVLQSSGDLRAVQEMLGHASIASTQVYTHLDFQYLAKAYDAAHPRARKRRRA
ncbi:MAG: tyrosine recombinase XerC [Casimicrobiaceae bacterium]